MNDELKNAINNYCDNLPYPNTGANPNDDRRLCKIAAVSHRLNEPVSHEYMKDRLQEHGHYELKNLNEKQLDDFIDNRISKIDEIKYYLDRLGY